MLQTVRVLDEQIRWLNAPSELWLERRDSLVAAHPSWDAVKDARIAAFGKGRNAVLSVMLAKGLELSCLISDAWWDRWFPSDRQGRGYTLAAFDVFAKLGIISGLFHSVESSLRIFLRALDPQACSQARADFEPVYRCLLTRLGLQRWEAFLRFWRLTRNTVHNNGIFYPRSGGDVTIAFDGITYDFRVGVPIDCADWRVLARVAEVSCDMLFEIVASPPISCLPAIVDPCHQVSP